MSYLFCDTGLVKQSLTLFVFVFAIFLLVPSAVHSAWYLDRSGTVIQVDGSILGEEDEERTGSDDSQDDEDETEDEDELEDENESEDEDEDDSQADSDDDLDDESEVEDSKSERTEELKAKLELETEARKKRLEARREMIKSYLEVKNNRLKIRQETENELGKIVKRSEVELEDDDSLLVEQEDEDVELSPDDDELDIKQSNSTARTALPISIGANNELIITRPDGTTKIVSILPAVAADKLRARGLEATEDAELTVEGAEPVYNYTTSEIKRVLGIFKVKFNSQTKVSAETGEILEIDSVESNPFRLLLERLVF